METTDSSLASGYANGVTSEGEGVNQSEWSSHVRFKTNEPAALHSSSLFHVSYLFSESKMTVLPL